MMEMKMDLIKEILFKKRKTCLDLFVLVLFLL